MQASARSGLSSPSTPSKPPLLSSAVRWQVWHDAIVNSGILIKRRYDIPEDLIPRDSRDEIDAKFAAGYWFATQVKELSKTAGRLWEDLAH